MNNSSSEGEYYEDLAEEWEGCFSAPSGGGKVRRTIPTTLGRRRVGGKQPWGVSSETCSKGCAMKCCKRPAGSPNTQK